MAQFQIVPADPPKVSIGSVLANLISGYMQETQNQQAGNYERQLMESLTAGKPIEEAAAQEKPSGVLGGLFDRLNPRGNYRGPMSGLSPITQQVLASAMAPKVRDPLETQRIEAGIKESEGRAKYYEQGGARSNVNVTVKPISSTERKRVGLEMDSFIEAAEEGNWGGPNFTQDRLLEQWENYKAASGYDHLPENQKEQLWLLWNTKIENKGRKTDHGWFGGNEYQWDPKHEDVQAAGGVSTVRQAKPAQYPDAVWNNEHGMWTVVRNGRLMGVE